MDDLAVGVYFPGRDRRDRDRPVSLAPMLQKIGEGGMGEVCYGTPLRQHHCERPFTRGQAAWSALQSRGHIHVLSIAESGVVGCGVLLRRTIPRRGCARSCSRPITKSWRLIHMTLPPSWLRYTSLSNLPYPVCARTPPGRSSPHCLPATGTPFGSISSGRLWACWQRLRFFFWPVNAKIRIARSCITTTTSAAPSSTPGRPPRRRQTRRKESMTNVPS